VKLKTTKLILNIAAGVAIAATAALMLTPAMAAPATTNSNVNVRSGPGPSYGVVDTLRGGTRVEVGECRGSWCAISTRSTDGWVSSGFLSRTGGGGGGVEVLGPADPNFGISIGPGGVQIGIGAPGVNPPPGRPGPGRPGPGPRPPIVEPSSGEVCFFDRSRRRGDSFCMEEGDAIRRLGDWADRISSIDNPDGLEVRVCYEPNFRDCRTYTSGANTLGDYDDSINSIQVR
jgi:uncharacterized protein YraI